MALELPLAAPSCHCPAVTLLTTVLLWTAGNQLGSCLSGSLGRPPVSATVKLASVQGRPSVVESQGGQVILGVVQLPLEAAAQLVALSCKGHG